MAVGRPCTLGRSAIVVSHLLAAPPPRRQTDPPRAPARGRNQILGDTTPDRPSHSTAPTARSETMIEHDRDQSAASEGATAGSESRQRAHRISGLADLLPDWILPPEGKEHIRNARKEMLMAARSV